MARFKFILWLAYWYSENEDFEFEWDRGNHSKCQAKHDVSPEEVESVFDMKMAIPLGHQVTPEVEEERLCIVGPTSEGRMLSVVFTLREGRVRPISSRNASRKERKFYEEIRKTLKNI